MRMGWEKWVNKGRCESGDEGETRATELPSTFGIAALFFHRCDDRVRESNIFFKKKQANV